jgi:predicted DNA-binding transcriptional regulator AlpA
VKRVPPLALLDGVQDLPLSDSRPAAHLVSLSVHIPRDTPVTVQLVKDKELLTVEELAALLGLATRTVYVRRWRHPEDLPPAIIVGTGPRPVIRFRRRDVDEWLDARTERLA